MAQHSKNICCSAPSRHCTQFHSMEFGKALDIYSALVLSGVQDNLVSSSSKAQQCSLNPFTVAHAIDSSGRHEDISHNEWSSSFIEVAQYNARSLKKYKDRINLYSNIIETKCAITCVNETRGQTGQKQIIIMIPAATMTKITPAASSKGEVST